MNQNTLSFLPLHIHPDFYLLEANRQGFLNFENEYLSVSLNRLFAYECIDKIYESFLDNVLNKSTFSNLKLLQDYIEREKGVLNSGGRLLIVYCIDQAFSEVPMQDLSDLLLKFIEDDNLPGAMKQLEEELGLYTKGMKDKLINSLADLVSFEDFELLCSNINTIMLVMTSIHINEGYKALFNKQEISKLLSTLFSSTESFSEIEEEILVLSDENINLIISKLKEQNKFHDTDKEVMGIYFIMNSVIMNYESKLSQFANIEDMYEFITNKTLEFIDENEELWNNFLQ